MHFLGENIPAKNLCPSLEVVISCMELDLQEHCDGRSWDFVCVCSEEQQRARHGGRIPSCVPKCPDGGGGFVWVCSGLSVLNCGCIFQCLLIHSCPCLYMHLYLYKCTQPGTSCSGSPGVTPALPSYKHCHFGPLHDLWVLLNSSELLGI